MDPFLQSLESDLAQAESGLLSSAIHGQGPEVWKVLTAEDFTDGPARAVAGALRALHDKGVSYPNAAEIAALAASMARRVDTAYVASLIEGLPNSSFWMRQRREVLTKRDALRAIIRAKVDVESGTDLWATLRDLGENLQGLRPPDPDETPWWEFDDILAFDDTEHRAVIPGALGEGERVVITGMEGYGKSTLVYQLCLGAAWGVNPLNPAEDIEPKRVFMLDVENWHETQVKQLAQTVSTPLRLKRKGFTPQFALSKIRQIDLLNPESRSMLLAAVEKYKPDLLFMGSGYKLVDVDEHQKMALAIQRTADTARSMTGTSVIIETHAGHGFQNDRNGWRPDGSSYWMRWPEFGFGLAPINGDGIRPVKLVRWRGDRRSNSSWPAGFAPGGILPWTALPKDEWEARYEQGGRNER